MIIQNVNAQHALIPILVKFWFHVHGIDVQATLLYPSRTLALTLKRMAAAWEHTSPNLEKKPY